MVCLRFGFVAVLPLVWVWELLSWRASSLKGLWTTDLGIAQLCLTILWDQGHRRGIRDRQRWYRDYYQKVWKSTFLIEIYSSYRNNGGLQTWLAFRNLLSHYWWTMNSILWRTVSISNGYRKRIIVWILSLSFLTTSKTLRELCLSLFRGYVITTLLHTP